MATVRHDLCQRDGYSLPDPSVAPTPEPSVDCVPVPIFRRNIAPWRAAAEPPKYAVDNQTVLLRTASAPPARRVNRQQTPQNAPFRSEEHTSELQSLMRISYAVFCLKKKQHNNSTTIQHI